MSGNNHTNCLRLSQKMDKKIIGWREWIKLPNLGVNQIKAKIDTGARTSALHAFDIETFQKDGEEYVRFNIHPVQRDSDTTIQAESKLVGYRSIRSSNGQRERRPVIRTSIELLDESWEIDITLTNRDQMGFRMLLGRQSFRRKMLVDVSKSYFGKKLKKRKEPSTSTNRTK